MTHLVAPLTGRCADRALGEVAGNRSDRLHCRHRRTLLLGRLCGHAAVAGDWSFQNFGLGPFVGRPPCCWDFIPTGQIEVLGADVVRALNALDYVGSTAIECDDVGGEAPHGVEKLMKCIRSFLWKLPEGLFDTALSNRA